MMRVTLKTHAQLRHAACEKSELPVGKKQLPRHRTWRLAGICWHRQLWTVEMPLCSRRWLCPRILLPSFRPVTMVGVHVQARTPRNSFSAAPKG